MKLFLRHKSLMSAGLILLGVILFFSGAARAEFGEKSPAFSSFAGYTGLWDMPNARFMPDWSLRMGGSYSSPFYYGFVTASFLERLEFNARMTGIRSLTVFQDVEGSDYGDFKDKSIDVKYLLFKEKDYRPAVALGVTDIHGTGVFTSRYLVASKRFGRLDLTLGVGQGLLAGKSLEERKDISGEGSKAEALDYLMSGDSEFSVFGGLEYALTDDLIFSAEYSSIDYSKILGGDEARLPFTFGLKYNLARDIYVTAAYARGEELSGGIYFQFPFEAEGPLGWKKEPKPSSSERIRLWAARADEQELAGIIGEALGDQGYHKTKVHVCGEKLWVEVSNHGYNSPTLAIRKAFLTVEAVVPPRITRYYFILADNGIFSTGVAASREHFRNYVESRIDDETFIEFSRMAIARAELWNEFTAEDQTPRTAVTNPKDNWSISFRPKLKTLLNDPSSFITTRISIDTVMSGTPWRGGLFLARVSSPIQNNINSSNKDIEPDASRTDFINYLSRKDTHIVKLGFDQAFELPFSSFGHVGVGAMDEAYAGMSGEVFRYFADGRLGAGLSGAVVWKRDPDNDFAFSDEYTGAYYGYLLNLYAEPFPEIGLQTGLRIGRFLAGDFGVRMDVARTFKHFTLGAWLTVTDTSHFQADYNRGYRDKGVYISIPLSIFGDSPSGSKASLGLSPWTRDTGYVPPEFRSLYPLGSERDTPLEIKKSLREMRW